MRASITVALISSLSLVACNNDDSGEVSQDQINEYCDTFCGKLAECDALAGTSESSCSQQCKNNANDDSDDDGSSDCAPSKSDVDACVAAFQSTSCESLLESTPQECEDICPDDSSGNSNGGNTGSGQDGSGSGSGIDFTDATCGDLNACCPDVPEALRSACEMTVAESNDESCGLALDVFYGQYCP